MQTRLRNSVKNKTHENRISLTKNSLRLFVAYVKNDANFVKFTAQGKNGWK